MMWQNCWSVILDLFGCSNGHVFLHLIREYKLIKLIEMMTKENIQKQGHKTGMVQVCTNLTYWHRHIHLESSNFD